MDSELTDLSGVKGVTISTLQAKPSEGGFVNGDKTKLDGIEAGATADQTQADINGLGITAVGIAGATDGDVTITSDGEVTVKLDSDNDESNQKFKITNNADSVVFSVQEDGVVNMAGGTINIDGSNSNLELNSGSDFILEADNNGGSGASSIQYPDAGGTNRIMLAANSDVVILSNRASNGTVQIRANSSTAGGSGEVTVVTVEDDKVTISQDLDVTGNVLPGITQVKIFAKDFIPDDAGRPAMIDDTGSDRWLESHGTAKLYANVDIPVGFKATHVDIYGSATSAVTVYEADVNSKTVTSKGTGNIGTQINITDVNSDATNYILIELAQASGEEVYGGKLTIAKI